MRGQYVRGVSWRHNICVTYSDRENICVCFFVFFWGGGRNSGAISLSHFTDSHRNTMLNYHGLRSTVCGSGVMNSLEHSREV